MFFILMLIITYYYLEIDNYSIAGLYEASVLDWVYTVGLCFFSFWGLYFYTSAIQSGRYSFVVPLSSVTALFSFFTSAFIYNESLTLIRCISLLIIVASLLYHQREKLINFQISKEVVFILLCSIFWGISFVLYLIPIRKFGVLNFSFVLEGCVFLSAVVLLIIKDKKVTPPKFDTRSLFMSVVMGLMVAGGSVLNNLSLTELPVSINIIIGLLFEIIVLMTGLYIFKERLSFNDWILVVFISIGSFILMI
jgi:uncharacterized membrane protein